MAPVRILNNSSSLASPQSRTTCRATSLCTVLDGATRTAAAGPGWVAAITAPAGWDRYRRLRETGGTDPAPGTQDAQQGDRMKKMAPRTWSVTIVALLCLAYGVPSTTPARDSGTPVAGGAVVNSTSPTTRGAVPLATRGVSQPAAPTAVADEKHAFEATEQADRATAQARPAAEKRPGSRPSTCPRGVPTQSTIRLADTATKVPGVRIVHLTTQATVVVGQEQYCLSSGASGDNPRQGLIAVVHPVYDACAHPDQQTEAAAYPTPGQHGAVTMTAVDGPVVTFRTEDGMVGHCNVVSKQFLP